MSPSSPRSPRHPAANLGLFLARLLVEVVQFVRHLPWLLPALLTGRSVELAPPPALLAMVRDALLYHVILTPLALCWLVLGRLDKLDQVRNAMAELDTPHQTREAESVARDILDEVLEKAVGEMHILENEADCEGLKEVDDNVKIGIQLENESGYLSERDVEE